jgi:hypothetical protein
MPGNNVFAGIFLMPVFPNYIARSRKPFLIAAKCIQSFGRIMFDAIAGRMTKRL